MQAPAGEAATSTSGEQAGTNADLEFLETILSPDGTSLTVVVAITNNGSAPIQLKPGDITLSEGEGQPQPPQSVTPPLPAEVAPGQRTELTVVFANPPKETGVFRLLDMGMDLYY